MVDTENHAIRRIDADTGYVTTVAGGRIGATATDGQPRRRGWTDRTVRRWTLRVTSILPTATTTECAWLGSADRGRLALTPVIGWTDTGGRQYFGNKQTPFVLRTSSG